MSVNASHAEYTARINRAQDYIENHLTEELKLEEIAKIANFSPYHFHRIFSSFTGEPLYQFILRLRLEKAVTLLTGQKVYSITEIALDCGFSSSSTFARAFKERYGVSASQWREDFDDCESKNRKSNSKAGKPARKQGQAEVELKQHSSGVGLKPIWSLTMPKRKLPLNAHIEVQQLPEKNLAYVRHVGPYMGDYALFERLHEQLMRWATPRGFGLGEGSKLYCIYHDNPYITEASKLRLSMCVEVPEGTKAEGDIGTMPLSGGQYALARYEVLRSEYAEAWDAFMGTWLPNSGYQPGEGAFFEMYHNNPADHPEGKMVVDLVIPVKPL